MGHSPIEEVCLTDEEDQIMWNFTSSGTYAVQSLYDVINYRGVTLVIYVSSVWKLNIPSRV